MIKQITEQLELPLECIYQMALVGIETAKTIKKIIPNIPAMLQLPLEFEKTINLNWIEKAKLVAYGIAAGAATIIGALVIINFA